MEVFNVVVSPIDKREVLLDNLVVLVEGISEVPENELANVVRRMLVGDVLEHVPERLRMLQLAIREAIRD